MAVKVGNSWVSEEAYAYAKNRAAESEGTKSKANGDMLGELSEKFPGLKFSTNTAPFSAKGTNNLAISPNILSQMQNDPEKRLEYEALIYDCSQIQKTMPELFGKNSGIKAFGFIINADGSLGAWSISEAGGAKKRNSFLLPKKDKKSWAEKIRQNTKTASNQKGIVVEKKNGQKDNTSYLNKLQKQFPSMTLRAGYGIVPNTDGKLRSLTIHPKALEAMQEDTEQGEFLRQRIKDAEKATNFLYSYMKGRGHKIVQHSAYIDENGNFSSYSYIRSEDKLNERLREEAKENMKKRIERSMKKAVENRKEKAEKLLEKKLEEAEDGKLHLYPDDWRTLMGEDEKKTSLLPGTERARGMNFDRKL